jgi:glycosyltransferase involved in cell wall biosynthesis
MEQPLINILTRTSNRPKGFKINRESVINQTYKNINHIVCTDDKNSVSYIKENGVEDFLLVDREELIKNDKSTDPKTGRYSPHNLYFNEMIKLVDDGWVMYLDDDDRFVDNTCVQQIVDLINKSDEDTLIYWRMVYSNGRYLPLDMSNNKKPILGGIGSPCFTFNVKYKSHILWDGWKCGDFRVIDKLHNTIPKKMWLPKNLVFIPSSGFGDKKDI